MSRRRWRLLAALVALLVLLSIGPDFLPGWVDWAGPMLAAALAVSLLRDDPPMVEQWRADPGDYDVVLSFVPDRRKVQARFFLRRAGWEHAQVDGVLARLPAVILGGVSAQSGGRLVEDLVTRDCEASLVPTGTGGPDLSATQAPRPA